ncbi:hypothetical protein [Acidaminococcus massiliensis]|jgi:hypothetical protein|uniref:hypothetical protein n=1 Tax=Acidaminococcus massiliensis TaxID=1852375 RepID=UPI00204BAE29|nr:hypothetical protein [Acidaminococcus massiliensis]DAR24885.1 MAG TPA: hypothetical protein [Caudoviricetes sp.]
MQDKLTAKLARLIAENPSLPVKAMVFSDVVAGNDYNLWAGDVIDVEVNELWINPDDYRLWSRDEAESDLADFIDNVGDTEEVGKIQNLSDGEEFNREAKNFISKLPWMQCIVIIIDIPDDMIKNGRRGMERNGRENVIAGQNKDGY